MNDYVDIGANKEAWYETFIEDYIADGWLESLATILAYRNFDELYSKIPQGDHEND